MLSLFNDNYGVRKPAFAERDLSSRGLFDGNVLRIETRIPPGTAERLRLWLLVMFLSTYPLLIGALLAASGGGARFVLILIGVASMLSIVNLILVPWALIQDRRIEIGPTGIDIIAKISPGRLSWSYVRSVRVTGGRRPRDPIAFWIGGLGRRRIVSVNPAEHPEAISRLTSAVARYAPHAKRSGRINNDAWDPTGSVEGEFVSVDSSWGSLWILYSIVVAMAAVNFQLALVVGPNIIPSSTIRGAVVLVYFVMAMTFVSTANWMSRMSGSEAGGLTLPRIRGLARFGGAFLVALSALLTVVTTA